MSGRGPIALLAGVLAVALSLVGCGGGGSDPSTSSLSKAEFIKKADAICKAGGKRTQSEFTAYVEEKKISAKNEPTPAQFAEVSDEIQIPAYKRQVGEIRALGVPAGEEEQITALLDALDVGIEKIEDADPQEALESSNKMFAEADDLAEAYGLKVCGQSEG